MPTCVLDSRSNYNLAFQSRVSSSISRLFPRKENMNNSYGLGQDRIQTQHNFCYKAQRITNTSTSRRL